MAYMLYNQKTNTCFKFETKQELLWYWLHKIEKSYRFKFSFNELSMNGNDKTRDPVISRYFMGRLVSFQSPVLHVRNWMVLEQIGKRSRIVDPRLWTKEQDEVIAQLSNPTRYDNPDPGFRKLPCGMGRKSHYHRVGCASIWKQNIQHMEEDFTDEMEELDIRPVCDHTKPRQRGVNASNGWDNYDRRAARSWCCSKSWKDQRKKGHQWGKHFDPHCSTARIHMEEDIPLDESGEDELAG